MSVSISDTSADFYLSSTKSEERLDYLKIYAEKDMEIWLEVSCDDEMPPVKYMIDTYYDHRLAKGKGGYHLRVTEFYERMERQISVVWDDNPEPQLRDYCYHEYLLITEYRD